MPRRGRAPHRAISRGCPEERRHFVRHGNSRNHRHVRGDHLVADAVKQYASTQLLSGHDIKGLKLVEGRSLRRYADETKGR